MTINAGWNFVILDFIKGGRMRIGMAVWALLLCAASLQAVESDWKKDLGKDAPPLVAAGWAGTPVSLDNVRGNAVVLSFWNADVAC